MFVDYQILHGKVSQKPTVDVVDENGQERLCHGPPLALDAWIC